MWYNAYLIGFARIIVKFFLNYKLINYIYHIKYHRNLKVPDRKSIVSTK